MKLLTILTITISIATAGNHAIASNDDSNDTLQMRTTFIKGNKELPQVLYIVPWQELKTKHKKEKTLVLHSLFGDAFEPMIPRNSAE